MFTEHGLRKGSGKYLPCSCPGQQVRTWRASWSSINTPMAALLVCTAVAMDYGTAWLRLRAQLGAVSPGVPAAQAHRLHMDKTHWIVSRSCSAEMGTLGGLRGPRVFRRCSAWGRGASIETCRTATEWGQLCAVTAGAACRYSQLKEL